MIFGPLSLEMKILPGFSCTLKRQPPPQKSKKLTLSPLALTLHSLARVFPSVEGKLFFSSPLHEVASMNSEIWVCYLEALKNHVNDNAFSHLQGLSCRSMMRDRWELCLPDRSSLNYVETNLSEIMVEVLHDVLKEAGLFSNVTISLCVAGAVDTGSGERWLFNDPVRECVNPLKEEKASFMISRRHVTEMESASEECNIVSEAVRKASHLNERYSFDSFVQGNSNDTAYAAAKAVAVKPGGNDLNPLFIYGGVGLGKTHLMQAIGNEIIETSVLRVLYMTSEMFMNGYLESLDRKNVQEFRDNIRENSDILLIDDVQFIAGKTETQKEFFNTFNYLIEAGKQVVITSDKHPSELPTLEDRIRSRLLGSGTFDIRLPEYETRLAILKKKSRMIGFYLPDDVADYMARKINTNVRELEGCLTNIRFQVKTGATINLEMAKKSIEPFYQTRALILDAKSIMRCVSDYFGITVDDLMGKSRAKPFVYPRQIAMYLARSHTSLSFPDLGRAFGRDHTTVLHAVQRINDEKNNGNTMLENDIKRLEDKLFNI